VKRHFFIIAAALFLISYSNAGNSQESVEAPVSAPAEETATVTEAPVVETVSQTPAPVTEPAEQPQAAVAPEIPAKRLEDGEEIVLIDDALPEGSTAEGIWGWDTSLKESGEKSHTEPPAKAITEHSYRAKPIIIPKNSVIEQYVYLDPDNMPKGIMLKFRFENDGKEDEIGIYREGEEEVFIFNNDEPMLYDGTLPNAGKWEKLQIYCDDLGLPGAKLTGISFVTYGGRAYWDLTRIRAVKEGEQYPPEQK